MPSYSLNNTRNKNKPQLQQNTAQNLAQQVANKQLTPPPAGPQPPPTGATNAPPAGAQALKGKDFGDQFKSAGEQRPQLSAAAQGIVQPQAGAIGRGTFGQRQIEEQRAANAAADEAAAAAETRREENRQRAIEAAKAEGKREMEEKARVNKQETEEGVDINGDGKIGYDPKTGQGRTMTEEEIINTQIRKLLQGGASPEEIEKERQAMKGEMAVAEARDIQSTRARTGLGGMGLTGAAGAMESQVRQESARKQALTMADFERQQRSEAAQRALEGMQARRGEQVFRTESAMYEEEEGEDLDGDGLIGNTPVAEWKKDAASKDRYENKYQMAVASGSVGREQSGGKVKVEGGDYPGDYIRAKLKDIEDLNPKSIGYVIVNTSEGERVFHLYEGSDGKKYAVGVINPN